MDPQSVILDRQTHMEEFNAAMQALGAQIMSKAPDRGTVRDNAIVLRDLARQLPSWFPPGTGTETGLATRAIPVIWQAPEDFKTKAEALLVATQALADFSTAGDMSRLMEKAVAVDAACVACHRAYQQRP
jgi:cytochrome c556